MRSAARYGAGLLVLALLLVALPASRAVLTVYLIEPVAISLWAAWRVIASVNQGVYWLLLIVLCALLTIRVFSGQDRRVIEEERATTPRSRGPVERWQALFQAAGEGEGRDDALRSSLRDLTMHLFAEPGQTQSPDLRAALRSTRIPLPREVERYLLGEPPAGPRPFLTLTRLTGQLHIRTGTPARSHDARIDRVVEWLEAAVEMNQDES